MAFSNTFTSKSPLGLIPIGAVGSSDPSNRNSMPYNGDEFDTQFSGQNKYYRYKSLEKNRSALSNRNIHEPEIYNISVDNIIKQFEGIDHLSLKYADFAYLKDFGVYPNNRLIILRRFANPVTDDIYSIGNNEGPGTPISTIIGYVDNDKDFLNFQFGEEWEEAKASFKDILNGIGSDISIGGGRLDLGSYFAKGINLIPSPPASVLFQRQVLAKLGLINSEDASAVPLGDPNLIKQARARQLVSSDAAGSGLNCKINVSFTVRYEQKFIQGVDPTLVYMDILGTLLSMGTSKSSFYLGTNSKIEKFIREMINDPKKALKKFIEATVNVLKPVIKKLTELLSLDKLKSYYEENATAEQKGADLWDWAKSIGEGIGQGAVGAATSEGTTNQIQEAVKDTVGAVTDYVSDYITKRYRVQAFGIMAALTGAPSTPWHVTIGNPLRPILCSGDMECSDIDVKLGPQLSFNDLPTYIEATIKLTSARNNGLQELFAKLSTGGLRTVGEKKATTIEPGVTFWSNALNVGTNPNQTNESESECDSERDNKTQNEKNTKIKSSPNGDLTTIQTIKPQPLPTAELNDLPSSINPNILAGNLDNNLTSIPTIGPELLPTDIIDDTPSITNPNILAGNLDNDITIPSTDGLGVETGFVDPEGVFPTIAPNIQNPTPTETDSVVQDVVNGNINFSIRTTTADNPDAFIGALNESTLNTNVFGGTSYELIVGETTYYINESQYNQIVSKFISNN